MDIAESHKRRSALVLLAALALAVPGLRAEEPVCGVGLNYPGLGLRCFAGPRNMAELRGQLGKKIKTLGIRGVHYFDPQDNIWPFLGVEADYLSFKGAVSDGSGLAASAMAGGELFLSKRVSVQFDVGPAYIVVRDRSTSLADSGLEYVANFGINFYFGSQVPSDMRDAVGTAGPMHAAVIPLEPAPAPAVLPAAPVEPAPAAFLPPAAEPVDPFVEKLAAGRKAASEARWADAVSAFNEAIALKPREPAPRFELAYAHEKAKSWDEAASQFKAILEVLGPAEPGRLEALDQLGGLAIRRGDYAEAKARYLEAVLLYKEKGLNSPRAASAYAGLAFCLEKEGKLDSAIRNYEKSLELGPEAKLLERIESRLKRLKAEQP